MQESSKSDEFKGLKSAQRKHRSIAESIGSWILVVIGFTVMGWLGLYVISSFVHYFSTRGENLPSLVSQVQKDIDEIDANNSNWKVDEAEIELSFSLKNTSQGGTELKAASGEIGTERETAHRLVLTLRRVQPASQPQATDVQEGNAKHRVTIESLPPKGRY